MDIEGREESTNVEDRRGMGGGTKAGLAAGGIGTVLVVIVCLALGIDPRQFVGNQPGPGGGEPSRIVGPDEVKMAHFTKVIFHDTEVVWDEQFAKRHRRYEKPTLVLFNGVVESACGRAESAVGPFYCPGDHKVYIDLSFYRQMERELNAPGDFARAYVVAHEVGHHVQNLLGYSKRAEEEERRMPKEQRHEMSVRLELQADYFAGVWAYHRQKQFRFLQKGDLESAIHAAFEIGDDRLESKATGHVRPDTFTHGKSEQRMHWFKKGFDTGDVEGAEELFKRRYNEL
jgi:predicted metalloprotease